MQPNMVIIYLIDPTGEIESIDAELRFKHFRTILHIGQKYQEALPALGNCSGVWLTGPSGCGKSTKARADYPDYYLKAANKWWDGYEAHENVILEDLGLEHHVLGHHIKLWADKHDFIAECKGSSLRIRPKVFVVTSQYTIDEIWEDKQTRDALKRRFKVVNMEPDGPLPDIIKRMQENNKEYYN